MFDRPDDSLRNIAARLGLDRADTLQSIQAYLDQNYPGHCRAQSLYRGVLRIVTDNASVASELRLIHFQILKGMAGQADRISVVIGQISG